MPFTNSITGAGGSLVRPAIHSEDYAAGVAGWTINRDGSAEFNAATIRGNLTAGSIVAGSIGSSSIVGSEFMGGSIIESHIELDAAGGQLLLYSTTSGSAIFTTPGATTWTAPPGVTSVKAECWGGGGAGGTASGPVAAGGGGGGEYAAELALAVVPGTAYAVVVGAGGATVNGPVAQAAGGNSSFAGTVLAHGGSGPSGTNVAGAAGGTGSTNSVHFNGGSGGNGGPGTPPLYYFGGGGGGASGGPAGSGGNGGNGVAGGAGGAGGVAPAGGGAGGLGPSDPVPTGTDGTAPGGGGSGASAVDWFGGDGANGKVVLTWATSRVLIGSISPAAATDSAGNPYPAGIAGIAANGGWVALDSSANIGFGASGSARDTRIYRGSAGTLGTDPLYSNMSGSLETWHAMTILGGWKARGAPYAAPSYRKVPSPSNGLELRFNFAPDTGVQKADGTQIWQAPAGYRPSTSITIPVNGGGTLSGVVELDSAGALRIFGLSAAAFIQGSWTGGLDL